MILAFLWGGEKNGSKDELEPIFAMDASLDFGILIRR